MFFDILRFQHISIENKNDILISTLLRNENSRLKYIIYLIPNEVFNFNQMLTRFKLQFIIFLNKLINVIKRNYWFIK